MPSDTMGGKGQLCCPEKGWKATFFISPAQEGKVGRRGGCVSPPGVGKRVWKPLFLSFVTGMVKWEKSYLTP